MLKFFCFRGLKKKQMSNLFKYFKSPVRFVAFILAFVGLFFGIKQYFTSELANLCCELFGWGSLIFSFREVLLPIKKHELKKFIPLVLIFCSAIFIYTTCRQLKDTLVIGGAAGAVGAVYAKVLVLICSYLYQHFYVNRVSRKYHFSYFAYFFIIPLVIYYIVFNFFLLDNPAVIPSATTLNSIKNNYPILKNMCMILSEWPRIMYYVVSEVWSVAVVIVLCWQLANRYVKPEETGRFYPSLMIVTQFCVLLSGYLTTYLFGSCGKNYKIAVNKVTLAVIIFTIIIFLSNIFFFNNVAEEPEGDIKKKDKKPVNIISIIKKNPKYFMIAMITVYYGLCSIFLEQFWKDKVKLVHNSESSFGSFTGSYYMIQSRLSIFLSIIGSNLLMRYTSWFVCASLAPILAIVGSFLMFGTSLFGSSIPILNKYNSITTVVVIGTGIIAIFKTLKYVSTDPSKEEYIAQQTPEDKREIKNLEGILGRIGKSGGAIGLALLFFIPNFNFRHIGVIVGLMIASLLMGLLWIFIVYSISKDVKQRKIT